MAWILTEVPDDTPNAITDDELIGISILAIQNSITPSPGWKDSFYRFWEKIQHIVRPLIDPSSSTEP